MVASNCRSSPRMPSINLRVPWYIICIFAASGGALAGEILYNGIALPDQWPPLRSAADMRTLEPMRVPYLEKRPGIVPIDVGRQLFVDDFLVESTTLVRRFH